MIAIHIPGRAQYQIEHIVFDVNGTLCLDGILIEGVQKRFQALKEQVQVHLVTADTYGKQNEHDRVLSTSAHILQPGNESEQKAKFVEGLLADAVIAVGQGANDAGMLKKAAIGIAILSREGLAVESLLAADLILPDIQSLFECLENPRRLVASLRK